MFGCYRAYARDQLARMEHEGLFKRERVLSSPQGARVRVADGREVLNFCANNYLGLANHPEIIEAARAACERWGYGLSSVRFICGTQEPHRELEEALSRFLGAEDTLLYSSCFDANGGLFETLLTDEDAVLSDALNHASIIDGIRLCKARRCRYRNGDMADLEARLKETRDARFRMIATDGVFSMDGAVARLNDLCDLAERYNALVMVDDSHAVGVLGENGRGTHEFHGVIDRVDILTGTLGKALGGASGGYASGRREIIALLRQRSRPYLFSNSVAPALVAGSLKALEILARDQSPRERLWQHTRRFRQGMTQRGFRIIDGDYPIVPVLLGDASASQLMAERMLAKGVYVIGFFYPVVPQGQARIRVQLSAAHSAEDIDFALNAFSEAKNELGL